MMDPQVYKTNDQMESLELGKLFRIFKANWKWLILLFLVFNLAGYLFLRWTKPVYESFSEIKLNIESDAVEFGYGGFFEEKNLSIISGEIELLKSGLFFDIIIDSLNLNYSYFTKGNILNDEKYPNPYYSVKQWDADSRWIDVPIHIKFTSNNHFMLSLDETFEDFPEEFQLGDSINLSGASFQVNLSKDLNSYGNENHFFIVNSRRSLHSYFENHMDVQLLNLKANTLKISIQDKNKYKAKDLVNAINNLYINYTQREKSRTNKKKIEWINNQLSRIELQLDNYEDFFEDFTIRNRTANLDEDLRKIIDQINQIDSNHFVLKNNRDLIEEMVISLNNDEIIAPSSKFSNEVGNLVKKWNDLLLRRDQLGIAYKETTFAVRELKKNTEATKEEFSIMLSKTLNSIDKEISTLRSNRKNLENNFTQIPGKSTELNKNQRYYDLYEEFYLSLMQSKAEFEIAVAGTSSDFKILANASDPSSPIYPKRIFVYGITTMASFAFGIIFITVLYLLENKVNTLEDVDKLIPYSILGSIPKSKSKTGSKRLIVDRLPKSGISEALRTIRTNIQFIVPGNSSKVITITSNTGGEGKTFVSVNLGAILAQSNKKVVIVDLDMRKPQIEESLQLSSPSDKGVSTVLIRKHKIGDVLQSTHINNLSVITSGPIPPNPSELILNGEFEDFIKELRKEFDFIILDTPPIGLVTDGILAMKRSDLSIMVIRAGYSRKKDIKSIKRLSSFNDTRISVILNSIERSSVYGYNYGYYSEID